MNPRPHDCVCAERAYPFSRQRHARAGRGPSALPLACALSPPPHRTSRRVGRPQCSYPCDTTLRRHAPLASARLLVSPGSERLASRGQTTGMDEHRSHWATLAGRALRQGKAEASRRKCVAVARRHLVRPRGSETPGARPIRKSVGPRLADSHAGHGPRCRRCGLAPQTATCVSPAPRSAGKGPSLAGPPHLLESALSEVGNVLLPETPSDGRLSGRRRPRRPRRPRPDRGGGSVDGD
jgi:hypothetical protein